MPGRHRSIIGDRDIDHSLAFVRENIDDHLAFFFRGRHHRTACRVDGRFNLPSLFPPVASGRNSRPAPARKQMLAPFVQHARVMHTR